MMMIDDDARTFSSFRELRRFQFFLWWCFDDPLSSHSILGFVCGGDSGIRIAAPRFEVCGANERRDS